MSDRLNELHELPLADRIVDDLIREWLDRKFGNAYATFGGADNECPEVKALTQARHLHLDNYSYDLTPKILDALRRAGLMGSNPDGGADG